jgi:hypothetical protein
MKTTLATALLLAGLLAAPGAEPAKKFQRPGKTNYPGARKGAYAAKKAAAAQAAQKQANSTAAVVPTSPANPYELAGPAKPQTQVDKLVFQKLQTLGIRPAPICSDAVFVRRAYLDLIGTLPTGYEAREFILNKNPAKRSGLIDKLLVDDRFASYWAMKWSDLLRIKAEFPINLWPNAVQAYHRWILTSIRDGMPYDKFARELLTGSGSNFRVPEANFYRAMQNREPSGIAQTVALTFMGVRAEKWPAEKIDGMAGFFSQIAYKSTGEWKEEIVMFDPGMSTNNLWKSAVFPDGKRAQLAQGNDPRLAFTDWLVNPSNPWFTKSIANRAWSWFFGRGIIHEPDDIRPDNPPVNAQLLAYLERELINSKYDLRHLFKVILVSSTYQLSSLTGATNAVAEANFAYYPMRRIEAEVLIDALNQITGTSEKYSSAIPEPPTVVPASERSIELADGSITSSFLELFGRPSRDTGYESERNNKPTAAQRLHLLNSTHIQNKIESSQMIRYQTGSDKSPREIAMGLYLGILSRFPTEKELKVAEAYASAENMSPRQAAVDLAWALVNSAEFLCRH